MNRFFGTDHGGDVYGKQDVVDFSASINPLGQPESVRAALNSCADACLCYPDIFYRDLRLAIADYEGVPAEWVVCGGGAADLIYRFALAFRPRSTLLLAPTFGEYERALRQNGCEVGYYYLREEDGFSVCGDILEAIPEGGAVILCNPNNPTGSVIVPPLLEIINRVCEEKKTMLMVDECFMDFVPDGDRFSIKKSLAGSQQAIILRAFTKIFAVPGVRLGYVLTANPETAAILEQTGPPWSVSAPAQLCGVAAAGEREFVRQTRETVRWLREEMLAELESLGLTVYPSEANYMLIKTDDPSLGEKLLSRGFQLRTCGGFIGLSDSFYRVAVRTEGENTALIEAIKEALKCREL